MFSWPRSLSTRASLSQALCRLRRRRHRMPGLTRCKPVTTTRSPGFRPFGDFAHAFAVSRADRRPTGIARYSCRRSRKELSALIGAQGFFRNDQRIVRFADRQADADEHPRRQQSIGIGKDAAQTQGAGLRSTWLSSKSILPLCGKSVFVGQAQLHFRPRVLHRLDFVLLVQAADAEQRVFVDEKLARRSDLR